MTVPPCPRCAWPMQVREHREVTERHRRQPYYYSKWYCCMQRNCVTTLVMPEEFKIWNGGCLRPGDDIALDVLSEGAKRDLLGDIQATKILLAR
jgi:hypothetical protein